MSKIPAPTFILEHNFSPCDMACEASPFHPSINVVQVLFSKSSTSLNRDSIPAPKTVVNGLYSFRSACSIHCGIISVGPWVNS